MLVQAVRILADKILANGSRIIEITAAPDVDGLEATVSCEMSDGLVVSVNFALPEPIPADGFDAAACVQSVKALLACVR